MVAAEPLRRQLLPILDCPCEPFADAASLDQALIRLVESERGGYSVAINAEKISRYARDSELRGVIKDASLAVPDGAGAVIGLRWLHRAPSMKVDLPRAVLELSNARRWRLLIAGASEESNAAATRTIADRYPGIVIAGRVSGYVGDAAMIAAVRGAKPQIMLLAMGSPRQELMAKQLIAEIPGLVVIGCGGAVDILAGRLRRAPRFMVENNLEWFYRLYKEPARWRRQRVLFGFFGRLLAERARRRFKRTPSPS